LQSRPKRGTLLSFRKSWNVLVQARRRRLRIDSGPEKNVRTEGLWIKCLACRGIIFKADLEANLNVCPKCQHHFKIDARKRIGLLLEPGYELVDRGLRSTDR